MIPTQPISLEEAITKYKLSRPTIARRCKEGVLVKFSFLGSRKVFLDEAQLISALKPKAQAA